MQLKRQSVEAWKNEKHYSKGNNYIPARTQSQDKKFQTIRPYDVRRSGQVTTFVVFCSFLLELYSCRVTYENCYKSSGFFQSNLR